jgi:hypothetical protein
MKISQVLCVKADIVRVKSISLDKLHITHFINASHWCIVVKNMH